MKYFNVNNFRRCEKQAIGKNTRNQISNKIFSKTDKELKIK